MGKLETTQSLTVEGILHPKSLQRDGLRFAVVRDSGQAFEFICTDPLIRMLWPMLYQPVQVVASKENSTWKAERITHLESKLDAQPPSPARFEDLLGKWPEDWPDDAFEGFDEWLEKGRRSNPIRDLPDLD